MARPFKCPYCAATRSIGKGWRPTKTMGRRQLRLCRSCDRKFTPRNQKQLARGLPKLAVEARGVHDGGG